MTEQEKKEAMERIRAAFREYDGGKPIPSGIELMNTHAKADFTQGFSYVFLTQDSGEKSSSDMMNVHWPDYCIPLMSTLKLQILELILC